MFQQIPKKSLLIFSGSKFLSDLGSPAIKFHSILVSPTTKFHFALRSHPTNFNQFGGPRQLLINPILQTRPGLTRAFFGNPQLEWYFIFRNLRMESNLFVGDTKITCFLLSFYIFTPIPMPTGLMVHFNLAYWFKIDYWWSQTKNNFSQLTCDGIF